VTLRLRNVQVDVPPERYDEVVAFWAAALGAVALGAVARPGDGPYTHLVGARAAFGLHLQRLGQGPARYHLDLEADDVEAATDRVVSLGATIVGRGSDGPVFQDPAAQLFCICPTGQVQEVADRDTAHAYLDAVVLDVPAPLEDAAAAFWAAALDVAPFERQRPGDPYRWSDGLRSGVGAYDLGVQRLPPTERARVHLDTICDDVLGEVERLTALGARVVARLPRWHVLADPVGDLFCVVDSSGAPTDQGG
jgi:predicted enzyme related to lactoylglutathione lyase